MNHTTFAVLLLSAVLMLFQNCGTGKPTKTKQKEASDSSKHHQISSWSDMVIWHCNQGSNPPDHLDEWPTEDQFSPRFTIKTEKTVSSKSDFRKVLEQRPEQLKKKQPIQRYIQHKGWLIAGFGRESSPDSTSFLRAYAVKKGTRYVHYWFEW